MPKEKVGKKCYQLKHLVYVSYEFPEKYKTQQQSKNCSYLGKVK